LLTEVSDFYSRVVPGRHERRLGQASDRTNLMYYFYVIKSKVDGKLYKGYTKDILKRLSMHNSGKVKSTKRRKPFKLIYTESFSTKDMAIEREKYFKSLKGGKELIKILKHI